MKARNTALSLLALLLSSASYTVAESPTDGKKPYTIGVSVPLTGDSAVWGKSIVSILEFANKKRKNPVKLIIEDDKCDGKGGASVAERLLNIHHVDAIIGYGCTASTLSAAPKIERAKKLAMVVCASGSQVAKAGSYIFRTTASDKFAAIRLRRYFDEAKFSHVATMSAISDYTEELITDTIAFPGDAKVSNEFYSLPATDLRTQLTRLIRSGADALFINAQAEADFEVIMKQLKELGWQKQIISAYYPSSPILLKSIPDLLEGVTFVDLPLYESFASEEGKSLYNEYRKDYGELETLPFLFGTTYDGLTLLVDALDKERTGGDSRAYLLNQAFHGTLGDFSFDNNGEIQGLSFVMKKIVGGKPEVVNLP